VESVNITKPFAHTNHTNYSWYEDFAAAQTIGMHLLNPLSTKDVDVREFASDAWKVVKSDIWDAPKTLETLETLETLDVWDAPGTLETLKTLETLDVWDEPGTLEPSNNRRLLQSSQEDAVTRFSTLSAGTDGWSNIPLGNQMADNWLEGPFGWPPR
jgi:hypothetical protein